MDVRYENSKGQVISFNQWPLALNEPERLFAHSWSHSDIGDSQNREKIKRLYAGIVEKDIDVTIFADNKEQFCAAMNRLHEIIDIDILANTKGRLYIDEQQYLPCYISASNKSEWDWLLNYTEDTLTLLTDYPFWITERKYIFRYIASADKLFLDYPYNYAYDFASEHNAHRDTINNTHYCACHFLAIFYGPCIDPSFVVDGHPYAVMTTLEEGEYLRLDTRDRTITKVTNAGDEINEFNNQRRDVSIFEKITPGLHTVTWNGTYGIDVILYEERSEPKWS